MRLKKGEMALPRVGAQPPHSWLPWFRPGLLVVSLQRNTRSQSVSGPFDQLCLDNKISADFLIFGIVLLKNISDMRLVKAFGQVVIVGLKL